MVADKLYDEVLAKTGSNLTAEQHAAIEECLRKGKSVKDTVKLIRKM